MTQELGRLEKQVATVTQEQERIRQNMGQLDRNTDLYKRYVEKFGTQEDEVERNRKQIDELTVQEDKLRKSLDDYLLNLNVG